MKERARELKAEAARTADGESDLLSKIAEMPEPDRAMAEKVHAIIKESAPTLSPKTWYGMPAYAKEPVRRTGRDLMRIPRRIAPRYGSRPDWGRRLHVPAHADLQRSSSVRRDRVLRGHRCAPRRRHARRSGRWSSRPRRGEGGEPRSRPQRRAARPARRGADHRMVAARPRCRRHRVARRLPPGLASRRGALVVDGRGRRGIIDGRRLRVDPRRRRRSRAAARARRRDAFRRPGAPRRPRRRRHGHPRAADAAGDMGRCALRGRPRHRSPRPHRRRRRPRRSRPAGVR